MGRGVAVVVGGARMVMVVGMGGGDEGVGRKDSSQAVGNGERAMTGGEAANVEVQELLYGIEALWEVVSWTTH